MTLEPYMQPRLLPVKQGAPPKADPLPYACTILSCEKQATVLLPETKGSAILVPLCDKHSKAWEQQG